MVSILITMVMIHLDDIAHDYWRKSQNLQVYAVHIIALHWSEVQEIITI